METEKNRQNIIEYGSEEIVFESTPRLRPGCSHMDLDFLCSQSSHHRLQRTNQQGVTRASYTCLMISYQREACRPTNAIEALWYRAVSKLGVVIHKIDQHWQLELMDSKASHYTSIALKARVPQNTTFLQ